MNGQTDQQPALWLRVLQFPLIRLVLLGGTLFFMMAVSNTFWMKLSDTPVISLAAAAGMGLLALIFYAGFVRLIERRPVSELALSKLPGELALGLLFGAGLYTVSVVILMMLGYYSIEGFNPLSAMLPAMAMAVSSGIFEELVNRGALFRILQETLGSWIALVVSALFFGFQHLLNPGGTIMGALCITIEAGVLLAAAFMVTRRLWLSIGIHMAWNYAQSGIYSGIVSGGYAQPGLLKSTVAGPALMTGGNFGIESSLVALLVCAAAGVVLLIIAARRGNIVAPFWQRSATQSQASRRSP